MWRHPFFRRFLFGLTRKSVTNIFLGGLAILCGRHGQHALGKPGLCGHIVLGTSTYPTPLSPSNQCVLAYNIVRKSLKSVAPYYEAPIRHESCQTTTRFERVKAPHRKGSSRKDKVRIHVIQWQCCCCSTGLPALVPFDSLPAYRPTCPGGLLQHLPTHVRSLHLSRFMFFVGYLLHQPLCRNP